MNASMERYKTDEIRQSLECAYIDSSVVSSSYFRPSFISNVPKEGKKVISEIEDMLLSCESYSISVAFITEDGITPLLETIRELDERGIKGRILTTNYLVFSDPKALDKISSIPSIELRMYDSNSSSTGFHTKGYIFKKDGIYRIIIGSSNLTAGALTTNREWNTKLISTENGEMAKALLSEFEELWCDGNTKPYSSIRDEYREAFNIRKKQMEAALGENPVSIEKYRLSPNRMQTGFILNLGKIIKNGGDRALLISATGTGKTYASAFAMRELGYRRVLFIVHRAQLAKQTIESYKKVFDSSFTFGILGAGEKERNSNFTFALIQTLSREGELSRFRRNYFDCIILDEAHHSSAGSYRKILDYFKPKLWLGMTATPDKRDDNIEGRNIYEIFNHQIAYEIRLKEAMEENLLCPFHYFGISDITVENYGRNLTSSDFSRLVSSERVKRIIEKAEYFGYSGDRVKGLVFCSRIDESIMLSEEFNKLGYRTIALNGDSSPEERMSAFERLGGEDQSSALDYIFSVEILNEGVDIIEVNQVIMLRPTLSPIVFIQQLGRGLRKAPGKEYVVILDFIGNYESNFLIPVALSGDRTYNRDTIRKYVISGNSIIPGSSTVHFDRVAKERIFRAVDRMNGIKGIIRESYINLRDKLGRRPYLMDFYEAGEVDPLLIIKEYRSYQNFIMKVDIASYTPLSKKDETTLEYLSKTILSGVRPYEAEIIQFLFNSPEINRHSIMESIRRNYGVNPDAEDIKGAVNILEGNFITTENEKAKYREINIIEEEGTKIRRGAIYKEIEKNEEYRKQLSDIVSVALSRYRDKYSNAGTEDRRFILYEKYSRRDISLLINAGKDLSSTMYGKYKKDDDVFLFVTYHKDTSKEDGKEYLDGKPDYSDRFEDNSIFLWDSQIGRGPESTYVRDVKDSAARHLLIKKSDRETSFYYMGKFDIEEIRGDKKKDNNGVLRDIAKVKMKMHNSVRDDLLRYLESAIEEEDEKSQSCSCSN